MKTKKITFSIPLDLITTLHSRINKGKLSKFVAKALQKAFEEDDAILKAAYHAANDDPDRLEILQDWA